MDAKRSLMFVIYLLGSRNFSTMLKEVNNVNGVTSRLVFYRIRVKGKLKIEKTQYVPKYSILFLQLVFYNFFLYQVLLFVSKIVH